VILDLGLELPGSRCCPGRLNRRCLGVLVHVGRAGALEQTLRFVFAALGVDADENAATHDVLVMALCVHLAHAEPGQLRVQPHAELRQAGWCANAVGSGLLAADDLNVVLVEAGGRALGGGALG